MSELCEQYTEDLTKKEMHMWNGKNDFGYVYPQGNIFDNSNLSNILRKCGGKPKHCHLNDYDTRGKGKAQPEYIITLKKDINTIIVIECKKSIKNHMSQDLDMPSKYAVDGVLYYAKYLKEEYNVIAIAVSGTSKQKFLSSSFYWKKGLPDYVNLQLDNIILEPENYLRKVNGDKIVKMYSLSDIKELAITMHEKLREIKMTEKYKPIFIAGILIALKDEDFCNEYSGSSSFKSLIYKIENAIESVLMESEIKSSRINYIKNAFNSISTNEKFKKIPLNSDGSILWYIRQLDLNIKPMIENVDSTLDSLGVFYHEFIKYAGGDGKGLGIVLTPQHLTEFMCDVAGVSKNTKVVDICCGTGAFLVSAMSNMFKGATPEEKKIIRSERLFGVELDDDLYTLSIANMIVRNDGKSNIYHGDCFSKKITKELSEQKIDIGLINPPYSQKDKEELEFVEHMLDILRVGGIGVVVVPMSCAIGTKFVQTRKRLFEKHSLLAVFSMPNDIFDRNASAPVCVMVWKAHNPHDSKKETFFGYYKYDGFVKKKKVGRVDYNHKWEAIKERWLYLYENKDIVDGLSARKCVKATDEWLCEAYMKTNYSVLKKSDFEQNIKNYLAYLIKYQSVDFNNTQNEIINKIDELDVSKWKEFSISGENGIFELKPCKCSNASELIDGNDIYYIGAKKNDNGVMKKVAYEKRLVTKGNCLIFICDGQGSVGYTNYMESDFIGSTTLTVGYNLNLNKYNGLFLVTVLDLERPKYSFGRKYKKTLPSVKVKLPVNANEEIDWKYMEQYIKSLPLADKI